MKIIFILLSFLSLFLDADSNKENLKNLIKVKPKENLTLKLPDISHEKNLLLEAPQVVEPEKKSFNSNVQPVLSNLSNNFNKFSDVNEIVVLFYKGVFKPQNIFLKNSNKVNFLFVNLATKPVALIIEEINKIESRNISSKLKLEKPFELYEELIFAIPKEFSLKSGEYVFRDALTGAKGTIKIKGEE